YSTQRAVQECTPARGSGCHATMKVKAVNDWRAVWNGGLDPNEFAEAFSPSVGFHLQGQTIVGASQLYRFVEIAVRAVRGLKLTPVEVLSHNDHTRLYYYWTADKWHSTIVGANKRSNLCQVAFRTEEGKIAEVWQQGADYIF